MVTAKSATPFGSIFGVAGSVMSEAMGRLKRLGPGLITACVVIGPGSILTSSRVGSSHGYSLLWVVLGAVVFMLTYVTLGAKLGVVASDSPGTLIARHAGRWLCVPLGLAAFFISAAFQFGNNLGLHSAFSALGVDSPLTIIAFNALSITFLYAFKNLYRALEVMMTVFVGLMVLSFAVNLLFAFAASPEPPGEVRVPALGWEVLGLVGTTFVMSAAFYQAYLVKQKGWKEKDLADGLIDGRVSAALMAAITLMIMFTAAAALRGRDLGHVQDVALGLKPLFGGAGLPIFCLGLFSAAYSSFLVNSMIAGFILSDCLGLGHLPTDKAPRALTALVLLTGMAVALFVNLKGWRPVPLIVSAQAVTVIGAPLMAGVLLWLTNVKSIMGDRKNGILLNVVAAVGFVLLLAMAGYTAVEKVWPALRGAP